MFEEVITWTIVLFVMLLYSMGINKIFKKIRKNEV